MNRADPLRAVRRLELFGYGAVLLLFGGAGVWGATTEISGAVIAPGTIVVQSSVKKVQHSTGGIISSINVHEGDAVSAGQVLVRLDDTVARATVGVLQVQVDELAVRQARLMAERDDENQIRFPAELDARGADAQLAATLAGERKLFESRALAKSGQRLQLDQRIAQAREEIRGLAALQAAKEEETALIGQELAGVNELWSKNLVAISRVMQLRRDQARLSGERGQYIAEIARAEGRINEAKLQIIQLDKDFRTDVLKELRETQGKIAELIERLVAARDQLRRVDILAPQDGTVHGLSVHTIGGVIANGEVLMEIVPRDDALIIDCKIEPRDIDQVKTGASATVRILAGDQRSNPDLIGKVTIVGADLTQDKTIGSPVAHPYYAVRVWLPPEETSRLENLKLMPGMQAEVFIQTMQRTPIAYLIKPMQDQIARAFRER